MSRTLIFATLATLATTAYTVRAEQPDAAPSSAAAASGSLAATTHALIFADADVALRLVTAPTGNAVRYRVREQLAGFDLPNDAVGETKDVSGAIGVDAEGRLVAGASKFTVNAATLVSDRDRRDNYIRTRTLTAAEYPEITLVPTAVRGISLPLPSSGTRTFEVVGDLTVRNVTRPTTWRVTATFGPAGITGSATTAFTFGDISLQQPRVRSVLSVADTIRLEYDFSLVVERPAGS